MLLTEILVILESYTFPIVLLCIILATCCLMVGCITVTLMQRYFSSQKESKSPIVGKRNSKSQVGHRRNSSIAEKGEYISDGFNSFDPPGYYLRLSLPLDERLTVIAEVKF